MLTAGRREAASCIGVFTGKRQATVTLPCVSLTCDELRVNQVEAHNRNGDTVAEKNCLKGAGNTMAASDKNCCVSLTRCFFDYSTPKTLVIRSKTVGAINRLCQALVIAYIIGYVCVWKKGYQDTDTVISSVTTKVKGIALTNTSDLGTRIWDVADYIIPPQEENSFFVLTNLNITPNQTQSHCPENPGPESSCSSDQDCKKGFRNGRLSGVRTGRCVHFSERIKTCEVLAWCPLEKYDEPPDPPMLAEAENFTVLIKNSVRYPKFNFSRRNILPHINSTYLTKCVFSRDTDPDCPIFSLRDIVAEAGEDFQAMAVHGGVMGVQIRWDCDLDMPANWCVPRYTFRRLDNKDPENNVAPGYNFRFAKYYKSSNGEEIRTLIKGYGIRFDIMVFGKAGKFNVVPTLLNIGAGLGLMGLVTVVCDWFVLVFMRKRHLYRERKYSYVDDFQLLSNEVP
ncbi:P2X purinoceptor 4 [Astyanax mexicanus]|uniref:P2X purinoceptor n=1 Tax=Astyanax mexicanus TaxID=7994 RepID=A0A8B9RJP6_ASTMX|nr:P2X purinoceptor 4 [Astyanax mexicanus]